jgi:hypothetical protein
MQMADAVCSIAEELKDMAFECVLMDDPVVAADGHTYNRFDIENWLKHHNTSPLTNEPLEHKILIPNIDKRRQINAWREEHGLPALTFGKPAKSQAPSSGVAAGGDGAQLSKPAAVCAFSKKALQGFCTTCKKGICIHCAMDPARCKSHDTRPLDFIMDRLRATHAAWVQLRVGRPERLQAQCDSVTAAANAAIDKFTRKVREEEADLMMQLQRSFVSDLDASIAQLVLPQNVTTTTHGIMS